MRTVRLPNYHFIIIIIIKNKIGHLRESIHLALSLTFKSRYCHQSCYYSALGLSKNLLDLTWIDVSVIVHVQAVVEMSTWNISIAKRSHKSWKLWNAAACSNANWVISRAIWKHLSFYSQTFSRGAEGKEMQLPKSMHNSSILFGQSQYFRLT